MQGILVEGDECKDWRVMSVRREGDEECKEWRVMSVRSGGC